MDTADIVLAVVVAGLLLCVALKLGLEFSRKLQVELARERHADEEAREEQRQNFFAQLEVNRQLLAQYDQVCAEFTLRPHLQDEQWLNEYARAHTEELLRRSGTIVSSYKKFHENRALIDHLKENAPEIYQRAVWEMVVLAKAEVYKNSPGDDAEVKQSSTPSTDGQAPRRPPRTTDEWRNDMLKRIRTSAQDMQARTLEILTAVAEYRQSLEQRGLDPDEIDRLVAEFRARLLYEESRNEDDQYQSL